MAIALRLTVRFNTVERGRARLSTVEHGRETVEIRYTAVQRGSFNRTLPRSTAARWDLGIMSYYRLGCLAKFVFKSRGMVLSPNCSYRYVMILYRSISSQGFITRKNNHKLNFFTSSDDHTVEIANLGLYTSNFGWGRWVNIVHETVCRQWFGVG